ncbi:hypothetical protein GVAMD_0098 [Gardnerella vaginalis AMD]|nr:hypothetical protein GVAMD_0098 [Gardnerella vaginalis AMD]
MKHRIAASARAIGSRVRRSLDLVFFVGFGAGFDAVAESWVDSVAGFALD